MNDRDHLLLEMLAARGEKYDMISMKKEGFEAALEVIAEWLRMLAPPPKTPRETLHLGDDRCDDARTS